MPHSTYRATRLSKHVLHWPPAGDEEVADGEVKTIGRQMLLYYERFVELLTDLVRLPHQPSQSNQAKPDSFFVAGTAACR